MDPDIASSYRPISSLSFISTLIERLVVKRFSVHVNQHTLLPAQQSAYRPVHSTETAVLSVHNDLVRAVDDCRLAQLVLLGLQCSVRHGRPPDPVWCAVLSDRFGYVAPHLTGSILPQRADSVIHLYRPCHILSWIRFGPVGFTARDLTAVSGKPCVHSHMYADDTQLHDSSTLADAPSLSETA